MSLEAMNWVFTHSPHIGTKAFIHMAMADSVNDQNGNKFWMRHGKLAVKAHTSRQTVTKFVRELIDTGFLELVEDNSRSGTDAPNVYRFLMPTDTRMFDSSTRSGHPNDVTPDTYDKKPVGRYVRTLDQRERDALADADAPTLFADNLDMPAGETAGQHGDADGVTMGSSDMPAGETAGQHGDADGVTMGSSEGDGDANGVTQVTRTASPGDANGVTYKNPRVIPSTTDSAEAGADAPIGSAIVDVEVQVDDNPVAQSEDSSDRSYTLIATYSDRDRDDDDDDIVDAEIVTESDGQPVHETTYESLATVPVDTADAGKAAGQVIAYYLEWRTFANLGPLKIKSWTPQIRNHARELIETGMAPRTVADVVMRWHDASVKSANKGDGYFQPGVIKRIAQGFEDRGLHYHGDDGRGNTRAQLAYAEQRERERAIQAEWAASMS